MPNQIIINTGQNGLPGRGDMFEWRMVDPGSDGTVTITCSVATGSAFAFALTALRIVEDVPAPPMIVTHPRPVVADIGDPATFSVLASGNPLFYQWYRNGIHIPNATNANYTILSVSSFDGGVPYHVSVSNQLGMVTSQTAEVIILPRPQTLLTFGHTWLYENSGSDLGTGWKEVDFVATDWQSGPGPLGLESATLPIPLATVFPSLNGEIIYYFRTTFVFDGNPNGVELIMTNMLDDGAVMYLNGVEVFRSDSIPPGPVDAFTSASPAVGDASLTTATIPSDGLVMGTNVFAVEMHQAGTGSSDIVFGMNLTASPIPFEPILITGQPEDVTVLQGHPASFTVTVDGTNAEFQWFKNGELIPDATGDTLDIPMAMFSDAGLYRVRATNDLGSVLSREAVLTVVPLDPPVITQQPDDAAGQAGESASIMAAVEGNEPLSLQWLRNGQAIPGATNDSLLLDFLLPHDAGSYSLLASNLAGAVTSSNATLTVTADPLTELPFAHPWRYEASGMDLGPDWFLPDRPDQHWPHGAGPLGRETDPLPESLRTTFNLHGGLTYYFRTSFLFANVPVDYVLDFTVLIDDGAVWYLNGLELHRVGMPPGVIEFTSAATRTVGDASFESFTLPAALLRQGVNVLAVEVHQHPVITTDAVMGTQVNASFIPPTFLAITSEPKDLVIGEYQDARFEVQVSGKGARYQWFHNDQLIPDAHESFVVLPLVQQSDSGIVHVVVSNSINQVTSRLAALTVTDPRPIAIVTQPGDQTVLTGLPFSLDADVEGDLPRQFQWWHEGQPIPGATNQTLFIPVTFASDAGTYFYRGTNALGEVESDPFQLDVLPVPRGPLGSVDTNFNSFVNGLTRAITPAGDGSLYVAGAFTDINGTPQSHVARLTGDGSLDRSFAPVIVGDIVYAVAVDAQDRVLLGGAFSMVNGATNVGLVRLLPDGSLDPEFSTGTGLQAPNFPNIRTIALQPDGRILIGGFFSSYNGISPSFLARLLENGDVDETFDIGAGPNNGVMSIALQPDGRILVGGRFDSFDNRSYLVRLQSGGAIDENFLAGESAPDNVVNTVHWASDHILVGGQFNRIGGQPLHRVARLTMDAAGTPDPTFSPRVGATTDYIDALLEQPHGQLILAGRTAESIFVPFDRGARLHPDGGVDRDFPVQPGANDNVWTAILLPDGDILVGGEFTGYHDIPRGGLARLVGGSGPYLRMDAAKDLRLRWPTNHAEAFAPYSSGAVSGGAWTLESIASLNETNGWFELPASNSGTNRFYRLQDAE